MHTLIFATNNNNKVAEVKNMLDDSFNIISLADAGIEIDIPEPMIRWRPMRKKSQALFIN